MYSSFKLYSGLPIVQLVLIAVLVIRVLGIAQEGPHRAGDTWRGFVAAEEHGLAGLVSGIGNGCSADDDNPTTAVPFCFIT